MCYREKRRKRVMSGFQDWVELSEIGKIKKFVKFLGYARVSDSSSQNQVYAKNGNTIAIRERRK